VRVAGAPPLRGSAGAGARVDERCLTGSPRIVGGDGPRIAIGEPVRLAARPAHLVAAGDLLLGRWLVQR
jgi:hypothetical protein